MLVKTVSREDFYKAIDGIDYREQDIKEAFEFGCTSIKVCYDKANHSFARYYLICEDNGTPVVTIMLQRDGHLVFFISNIISSHISLVKALKRLADETILWVGPIFTKTAYWYTEAQRLNKLIGFRPYQKYNRYGIYVKSD